MFGGSPDQSIHSPRTQRRAAALCPTTKRTPFLLASGTEVSGIELHTELGFKLRCRPIRARSTTDRIVRRCTGPADRIRIQWSATPGLLLPAVRTNQSDSQFPRIPSGCRRARDRRRRARRHRRVPTTHHRPEPDREHPFAWTKTTGEILQRANCRPVSETTNKSGHRDTSWVRVQYDRRSSTLNRRSDTAWHGGRRTATVSFDRPTVNVSLGFVPLPPRPPHHTSRLGGRGVVHQMVDNDSHMGGTAAGMVTVAPGNGRRTSIRGSSRSTAFAKCRGSRSVFVTIRSPNQPL